MFWENSIQAIKVQTSVVICTGHPFKPDPKSDHPIWEDLRSGCLQESNRTWSDLLIYFFEENDCLQFLSFDMWSSMSFLKVLQILWVMWYIQWTQKSYHVSSGCLEEIENNGKIIKLSPHELTRGFQLLLSTWDLTHASLSSSEQWFAYFIHVDNETRVYIYCINFCQTIMVPFTVCLPPIIFRGKYICDKLLCWTLLPKGWWDLSVHFYVLGRSGLLIFRAVAEPRNSGKSAKSREIRKKSYQIHVCTTYLKLISAIGAIYLP